MPGASLSLVSSAPPDPAAPLTARILIVDDDERNAFAAAQALEDLGHELVIARSGPEALRCLLEDDFAVILLDLHMPEMDGFETASMIRSRRRTMLTPIVFLTAIFRDEAHVFQAYSAGAVDVVFKPVDPFILRSKVKVLADLRLKTAEVERQAAYQEWLLFERDRIEAERAETERRLRRSEARLAAIQGSLPIIFHARGVEPPYVPTFVGGAVREITGFTGEEFLNQPDLGSSHIHPDDLAGVVEAVSGAVRTGAYNCEFRWRCGDGGYRLLQDQGVLAPATQDGQPKEIWGSIIDVTERRSLEEQLAHARKMEAVGQLTGGVAHDFNNLLTVILGNADMLAERREDLAKRDIRLGAIRQAADRGRTLTRQLLAFARRQHLNPEPCDVNALIRGFAPLLRHAVGEGVTVECHLGQDPYCATIDSAQLETALLNLCVNARDAMLDGGVLQIATQEISDDQQHWIEINVTDNGVGMTSEVRERAFEPFFTTKELGLGSGLGLSQVYGFVNQSGGEVRVESVPRKGSVFRLRLPASPGPAPKPQKAAIPPLPLGGSEVVLVVEDDSSVLALTVDMLKGQGYSVLTATNAAEAIVVLKTHPEVQILFSDVTMPGMSGVGLARQALRTYPNLRILLTSGFVGDASGLGCEFPMLDKPFDGDALAAALRKVLDAPVPEKKRARHGGRKRPDAAS